MLLHSQQVIPREQAGQVEKVWLHDMRWVRATAEKTCKGVVGRETVDAVVKGEEASLSVTNVGFETWTGREVSAILEELSNCLDLIL